MTLSTIGPLLSTPRPDHPSLTIKPQLSIDFAKHKKKMLVWGSTHCDSGLVYYSSSLPLLPTRFSRQAQDREEHVRDVYR